MAHYKRGHSVQFSDPASPRQSPAGGRFVPSYTASAPCTQISERSWKGLVACQKTTCTECVSPVQTQGTM